MGKINSYESKLMETEDTNIIENDTRTIKTTKGKMIAIGLFTIGLIALIVGIVWVNVNKAENSSPKPSPSPGASVTSSSSTSTTPLTVVPRAVATIPKANVLSGVNTACDAFSAAKLACSVNWEPSSVITRGNLIKQTVNSGDSVPEGTAVQLIYSSGPSLVALPDGSNVKKEDFLNTLYYLGIDNVTVSTVNGSGLDKDYIVTMAPEAGTKVLSKNRVRLIVSSGKVDLPNWVNKTQTTVSANAEENNINVKFVTKDSDKPVGIVLSQNVKPGLIDQNTVVTVTVSNGNSDSSIVIPDVIGQAPAVAQSNLALAGFKVINVTNITDKTVTSPTVTSISPNVGANIKSSDPITITVSNPAN